MLLIRTGGKTGKRTGRCEPDERTMIDPMLIQKLSQTEPSADALRQLALLDPSLTMPAALPLLLSRLMGPTCASGDEGDEGEEFEPEMASA